MRGALAIILYVGAGSMWAAQRYPVTGLVLKIDQAHRTFVASCTAIPGYMEGTDTAASALILCTAA